MKAKLGGEIDNGVSSMDVEGAKNGSPSSGEGEVMDADLQAALAMSMEDDEGATSSSSAAAATAGNAMELADGSGGTGLEYLPSNFCGNYELISLVSHKGRSSSSGHYIGYVKDVVKARQVEAQREAAKKKVSQRRRKGNSCCNALGLPLCYVSDSGTAS